MSVREDRALALQTWLRSWIECGSLPMAAWGIFDEHGNELFYDHTNSEDLKEKKIEKDSLFRIYSMTKPITSVAALILIERNILTLDQLLEDWIPSFKGIKVAVGGSAEEPILEDPREPIRIRHLLTHTSGISYGFFGNNVNDIHLRRNTGDHFKTWFSKLSLVELCDAIAKCPLCFHPGSKFNYGLSTDILGRVIEIASGKSLETFLHEEIFTPLEMEDTFFQVPPEKAHRLADCFEVAPGKTYKPSVNDERDRFLPRSLFSGGGGLVSTMKDYSKFATCLINLGSFKGVRILSAESVKMMTQNHLAGGADIADMSYENGFSEQMGPGTGFGLGVSVVTNPSALKGGRLSNVGEFGWGGVSATYFFIDPVRKISSIFMTQVIPAAAEYPIRAQQRWMTYWSLGN